MVEIDGDTSLTKSLQEKKICLMLDSEETEAMRDSPYTRGFDMAQGLFANRSVKWPIRQKQMLKICGKCDRSLWFPFTGLIQQIADHSNVLMTCLRFVFFKTRLSKVLMATCLPSICPQFTRITTPRILVIF